ncbi:MAG: DUF2268 domain-containing putative Zn-dependent protease [Gemmatimonas sp.]
MIRELLSSSAGIVNGGLRRLVLAVAVPLVSSGCGSSPTAPGTTADPSTAQIVTTDLARFWAAYDVGGKSGSASAFQTMYLDVASPGLKDFIAKRTVTAASLSQMVVAFPQYFASIRASNLALATDATIVSRIRANYGVIKALYPAATFPPLTLLVGRFSTGGTTSNSGLLVGSEFYSITSATPLGELPPFQRDNVKHVDSLPVIVAHEHAHALQAQAAGIFNRGNKNLLEQALLEGGADFIGERASGGNINGRLWSVAIPQESALWQEFKSAMHGTDISRWLYNQGTATATPTRPGDLGYFIGYRIAEAYYLKQTDKAAALKAIIEVKDADDFLARSGYAP